MACHCPSSRGNESRSPVNSALPGSSLLCSITTQGLLALLSCAVWAIWSTHVSNVERVKLALPRFAVNGITSGQTPTLQFPYWDIYRPAATRSVRTASFSARASALVATVTASSPARLPGRLGRHGRHGLSPARVDDDRPRSKSASPTPARRPGAVGRRFLLDRIRAHRRHSGPPASLAQPPFTTSGSEQMVMDVIVTERASCASEDVETSPITHLMATAPSFPAATKAEGPP